MLSNTNAMEMSANNLWVGKAWSTSMANEVIGVSLIHVFLKA